MKSKIVYFVFLIFAILAPYTILLISPESRAIGPVALDFIMLGLVLVAVSLFHHYTLTTAVAGLISVLFYNILFKDIDLASHFNDEKIILLNLLGLLLGFALLANFFEQSKVPRIISANLPSGWKGAFLLLVFVFILSSFLDNIAAALIGGTVALTVYNRNIHIGYIAAIVAASNAGGSGSVVGDTTTTMMWIEGVPADLLLTAYFAAVPCLIILGYFASKQQARHQAVIIAGRENIKADYKYLVVVILVLAGAIVSNIVFNLPALGVWMAIIIGSLFVNTQWGLLKSALKGSIFLLSLVTMASLMPVEKLPEPSWQSAFFLGFVSSVFDNIPLTKIALEQNGYDWGLLAYSVGYGGSMLWFGSSAGVAISNLMSEAKSTGRWLKNGWHIAAAYIVGFFILLSLAGWKPYEIG